VVASRVRKIGMDASAKESVDIAAILARELMLQVGIDNSHCQAVCAIPEPIGHSGLISRTSIQSRWHNTNPSNLLSDALGFPVHAENDTNLAIVGESIFGTGRSADNMLYVKIAHGVGLGIMLNGDLIRGATGLAGEIGHNIARPGGIVCLCGNRGCLYTLTTSEFLTSSLHTATHNPNLTHDDLVELGKQGHPGAGRVLRDAGREVGRILANLCNTLNPELVIVGGSLTRAGDWTLIGLQEEMEDYTEREVLSSLQIVGSYLGESAEIYGALAMAIGVIDSNSGKRVARDLPSAR
jgi:Transcriptional regulator/sugar kinase